MGKAPLGDCDEYAEGEGPRMPSSTGMSPSARYVPLVGDQSPLDDAADECDALSYSIRDEPDDEPETVRRA